MQIDDDYAKQRDDNDNMYKDGVNCFRRLRLDLVSFDEMLCVWIRKRGKVSVTKSQTISMLITVQMMLLIRAMPRTMNGNCRYDMMMTVVLMLLVMVTVMLSMIKMRTMRVYGGGQPGHH